MPQCPTQVRDADRQSKDLLRKREEEEASIAETMLTLTLTLTQP